MDRTNPHFLSFLTSPLLPPPRRVTGGGSQIKESPEGSPPVHISAGGRGTRRSGREKRQRRTSRICSWQLFQQPVFHWLLFCSPVTFFFCCLDKSAPIFIPNVRSNCCLKKEKRETSLARVLLSTVDSRGFFFVSFFTLNNLFFPFPAAVSSRSFHSPIIGSVRT